MRQSIALARSLVTVIDAHKVDVSVALTGLMEATAAVAGSALIKAGNFDEDRIDLIVNAFCADLRTALYQVHATKTQTKGEN